MSKTQSCEKQKETHSRHRKQQVQKPEQGKSLTLEELRETLLTWAKLKGVGVETPSVVECVGTKECKCKYTGSHKWNLGREIIRSNRKSLFVMWRMVMGSKN